jgi:pimeloyl-ACP methyl ester carboxylesterase
VTEPLFELFVEDSGEGRPLLLLHAFPLSSRMWEGQRATLAGLGRVLSLDFPGFGRSPPPSAPWTFESLGASILAELRRCRVFSVAGVGLSMGGYLLLELVRQQPDLFESLVLADTRAEPDTAESRKQREVVATRSEKEGVAHLLDSIPRLLSPRASSTAKRFVADEMLRASPQGVAAASRAMGARRDQRDLLPAIDCPTLVVVGEADVPTPVSDARRMSEAIPGAELRIFSGVGHLSNLEAADGFNRALVSFLGRG